ncbi:MAG TPA: ATP-binding protein, partial [Polyangiaceae bacterium]|nr:ATP-binding protein [Polyangiaceae bacterium]
MRIRSLTMKDFRGFEAATLDLDRPLTVLFGVNGSGKSSVLMACAFALSEVLRYARPDGNRYWDHVAEDIDIRSGADELSLEATLSNGDASHTFVVAHRHRRGA